MPSLATTLPSASRKLRYPTGSFSFELSPRSLRGRVVALAPSPPRAPVGGSFRAGLGVATEGREAAHRGLPLAFSAFSAFLLFSLFRSSRCFFAFLAAVTFVSDGGSSLVRAFGSGNSSCGSSSNNALRACLERGAAAFSSFSSFSAKGKTFSLFPAPGWSKRRAQVS